MIASNTAEAHDSSTRGQLAELLVEYPGIERVELVVAGQSDGLHTVAVLVAEPNLSFAALRRWLRERAPHLQVPDEFVITNLEPPLSVEDERPAYVKARNPVEAYLVRLWGEFLPAPRISVHDDFFALGGHSLLAARMHHALELELGVSIDFKTVLRRSVLADLSAAIIDASVDAEASAV